MTMRDRLAVGAWLAMVAVAGWLLVFHTRVSTDLAGFLPTSATPAERLLVDQLKDGVAFRLILVGIEGAPERDLSRLSDGLVAALKNDPSFSYVGNGAQPLSDADRRMVTRNRYLLSPAVIPGHFDPAQLRAALRDRLAELATPLGAMMKADLPRDPTGEIQRILLSWKPAGAAGAERHGRWFSGDGRRALLVAETVAAGFDADAQQKAADAVRSAFASLNPGPAQLLLSGTGVLAAQSRTVIERDSWRLSAIASALVVALLLTVYRSGRVVLLGMLPVVTGLMVGVAAVGQWFGTVHGITLGFGATLIGEAVDYPSYLFTHVGPGESVRNALKRIGPTLRLAVLTTVFGSLAMLLSSVAGLAQLGLLSVVGVFSAGLVTVFVLPALAPRRFGERKMQCLPRPLSEALARTRRAAPVAWALLAASLVVIAAHAGDLWDDDLGNLSPVPESAKLLDQHLRSDLGVADPRYLVAVSGPDAEAALRLSERTAAALRPLVDAGILSAFDTASRYLPSRETQAARRDALPDSAALAAALSQAQSGTPFKANVFAPFLADVAAAKRGRLVEERDFQGSALGLKIHSLLSGHANHWVALMPLTGVQDPAKLAAALPQSGDVILLDMKAESNRMVNNYRRQSLFLTGLGIVAIAIVVLVGLRDPKMTANVMAPVLIAVIATTAALVAMGERLSLFHLVSLLLVIGVGLNYALFFNRPEIDLGARRRTELSLTVCSLSTLSAFGALAVSQTPVLHAIGLTVALGSLLSLLLSMVLRRSPCDNISSLSSTTSCSPSS